MAFQNIQVIFVLILFLTLHTHVCATRHMPLRAKASSITLGALRMLQVVEFKSSQVSGNSWCTSLLWSSRAQSIASLSVTHPHLPGILNFLQPDQMAAPFAVSFDIWTPISPAPQLRDLRLTTQSVSPPLDTHKLLHTRTHTRGRLRPMETLGSFDGPPRSHLLNLLCADIVSGGPLSFGLHMRFFNYVLHFTVLVGVIPPLSTPTPLLTVGSRPEDRLLITSKQGHTTSNLFSFFGTLIWIQQDDRYHKHYNVYASASFNSRSKSSERLGLCSAFLFHVVHVSVSVIDSCCCLLYRGLGALSLDYFTGNKEKLVTAGPDKLSGLVRFTGSWLHHGLGSPQGSAARMRLWHNGTVWVFSLLRLH